MFEAAREKVAQEVADVDCDSSLCIRAGVRSIDLHRAIDRAQGRATP